MSTLCNNCVKVNILDLCTFDRRIEREGESRWGNPGDHELIYQSHPEDDPLQPSFLIAKDVHSLIDSATEGCSLCSFIYQAIAVPEALSPVGYRASNSAPIRLQIDNRIGSCELKIFMVPSSVIQSPPDIHWPALLVSPWDVRCSGEDKSLFEQAKSWIVACEGRHDHHSDCGKHCDDVLPPRLLDLGSDKDMSSLRLVQTNRHHKSQDVEYWRYIALSYVWGKPWEHRTVEGNIEQRQDRFSPDELPQTIKDAIYITKRLGCRFIWVDSLCIIQDSEEDKYENISRMEKIYTNARCVISASTASGADQGMLHNRDWARFNAGSVSIPVMRQSVADDRRRTRALQLLGLRKPKSEPPVMPPECQQRTCNYYANNHLSWLSSVDQAHIERRGWTFQERALAARRLCFSKWGLYWECPALVASEMEPEGLVWDVPGVRSRVPRNIKSWMHRMNSNGIMADKETAPGGSWRWLVTEYTQRKLTVQSDRLPALAGIARRWQKTTAEEGDVYLAGLWLKNLAWDLCWSCGGVVDPDKPSWSWGSPGLSSLVLWPDWYTMPGESISALTTCVAHKIEHESADRYSRIKHGVLVLRGPLCRVDIRLLAHVAAKRSFDEQKEDGRELQLNMDGLHDPFLLLMVKGKAAGPTDANVPTYFAMVLMRHGDLFRRAGNFKSTVADDFQDCEETEVRLG